MSTEIKNKIQICFDATELDNFQMCEFRWHMYHHRMIRSKDQAMIYQRGSLLHYFMEVYYKKKRELKQLSQYDIEEVIDAGRQESVKYGMSLEEIAETVFQVREYARFYEDDNIIPVFIEEPFMVKIFEDDDIEVYLAGKPDLVFRYYNSSDLNVMDHKRSARDFNYSPLRNQFNLYVNALNSDTFIVNKIGFQKTLKPRERFKRQVFVYSPEIKDEWREEVVMSARKMLIAEQNQYYPRNKTSCEKWEGCYLQRYCQTRPAAREFLIGTEYIIGEKWDVGSNL